MNSRRFLCLVALLLLDAALAVAAWNPPHKTLDRFQDAVILPTNRLIDLPDHHTAHYRLYRVQDGALVPIPYQFDARDADGQFVLSQSGTTKPFAFDGNDELVFMAKDTGDRLTSEVLPDASDAAREIEVMDPVTGHEGWAYVFHFRDRPPPRSAVRYVHFDPATNRVETPLYTLQYLPGRSYLTGLRVSPSAGGTNASFLERMSLTVNPTFSLLFTTWSPSLTENDFSVRIDGFKNGPVRTIRRVSERLNLGKFFPDVPGGTITSCYYFSSFTNPSDFSVPWLVLKALRAFRFAGVTHFGPDARGMTYWDSAHPHGLRFGGDGRVVTDAQHDHPWWVVSGKPGTLLQAFVIPARWRSWGIARGTLFVDRSRPSDPPEANAEPDGYAAGYSLLHMTQLRQPGHYKLNLATFILPRRYKPGDERGPMAMLQRPLLTAVQRVGSRALASSASAP